MQEIVGMRAHLSCSKCEVMQARSSISESLAKPCICSCSGSPEMWQVIKLEKPNQRSELHDVQSHLTLLLLLSPQISPYLLTKMPSV